MAGYLGQCPRFDQTFIFIASLICLSGTQSPLHTPSGNLCFVFFLPLSSGLSHLGGLANSSYCGGSSSPSVGPGLVPCCRLGGPHRNVKGGEGEGLRGLPPALIVNGRILIPNPDSDGSRFKPWLGCSFPFQWCLLWEYQEQLVQYFHL